MSASGHSPIRGQAAIVGIGRAGPGGAPDGCAGSVRPAVPPAARTASAISGSAQATATGPMPASRARSST